MSEANPGRASASESPDHGSTTSVDTADDPVRKRRDSIRRLTALASRLGYLLLLVAVVMFFVALATGFSATMASIVIAALVAACVLLAPAIVLGYAIKAADRADRDHTW